MKTLVMLASIVSIVAVFVLSNNTPRGNIDPMAVVNQSETITYPNGITRNETEISYNGSILVVETDRTYNAGDTIRYTPSMHVLCTGVNCMVESPIVVNQVSWVNAYAHTYDRPIHNMRHISTVYGPYSYVYLAGSMWK